jgi:hypothetical protein
MKMLLSSAAKVSLLLAVISSHHVEGGVLLEVKYDTTKACSSDGKTCKLDMPADLAMDEADPVVFQFPNENTTCFKSDVTPNFLDVGSSFWHGVCDGGFSANILRRGKNAQGEDLVYGSVVFPSGKICRLSPNGNGDNLSTCISLSEIPNDSYQEVLTSFADRLHGETTPTVDEAAYKETFTDGNLSLHRNLSRKQDSDSGE